MLEYQIIKLRDIASTVIQDSFIISAIKDIICLLETHCPFQESLILPSFSAVHLSRPKNKKTNKISGGISVFVKSELKPGIQFLEHMIIFGLSFVKAFLVLKMIFIYVTYI